MNVDQYFEKKEKFEKLIEDFFGYLCDNKIDIYNEFSFQHELGFFIRNEIRKNCVDAREYKIEFERNAEKKFGIYTYLKKEIDISIYNDVNRYAIELKFPLNRQYPYQMFEFIKDIRFMQELVNQGFNKTYCVTLVFARGKGRPFYKGCSEGTTGIDIYKYFRESYKQTITGIILNPRENGYSINLGDKQYPFEWKDCKIFDSYLIDNQICHGLRDCKYYIVECK